MDRGIAHRLVIGAAAALCLMWVNPDLASAQQPQSFQAGAHDREAFENWFTGLSGDTLVGASYWVAHRSSPNAAFCKGAGLWQQGCLTARQWLSPSDAKRRSDPGYREGWNSIQPASSGTAPAPIPGLAPKTARPVFPATLPSRGGGSSNAIGALFIVMLGLVAAFLARKIGPPLWRAMRRRTALRIARNQINSKTKQLSIRRLQLVRPDFYGIIAVDKWEKEKDIFIRKAILPCLKAHGVEAYLQSIRTALLADIERAARASRHPSPAPQICISDPRVFDTRMHPVHYEQYCAFELERAGWTTRATPLTGDQGADILAERAGIMLVVQCKLYTGSVGNDAVQQVIAARLFQNADLALVVSNASFTSSARDLAARSKVDLLHHSELRSYSSPKRGAGGTATRGGKVFQRGK